MKPKPRIFKADDGWAVDLPAFGFAPSSTRSGFGSWRQAGDWLASKHAVGSASQLAERTSTPEDRGKRWPMVIR